MPNTKKAICLLATLASILLAQGGLFAQQDTRIASGSKVYINPMNGLETYLMAALDKKKVPLVVVTEREKADFEISGASESQKAGWSKILVMRQTGSTEEASITVKNVKTGAVVFAYAVNKSNSVHGKQSAAEACAKHLKQKILSGS